MAILFVSLWVKRLLESDRASLQISSSLLLTHFLGGKPLRLGSATWATATTHSTFYFTSKLDFVSCNFFIIQKLSFPPWACLFIHSVFFGEIYHSFDVFRFRMIEKGAIAHDIAAAFAAGIYQFFSVILYILNTAKA